MPAKTKRPRRSPAPRKRATAKPQARADYGAPIDSFFSRQPENLRAILDVLRKLIDDAVPDVQSSLKWGMPFYTLGGKMVCGLSAHKSHVNLILAGPPGAFEDPDERLTGKGKTGRHLKLQHLDELPRSAVRKWVRSAADLARQSAKKQ